MHKSFKDICLSITEDEYRNDGNIHYSTLATYERGGFESIETLGEKKESASLLFGSVVDVMLTGTSEDFNRQYLVAEYPVLEPAYINIIRALYDKFNKEYHRIGAIPDNEIITMTELLEFYLRWKPQTRANAIKEKGEEYYNLLFMAEGKTLLDTQTYNDAVNAVEMLRTSKATEWYFRNSNPFNDSEDIERLYQMKLKADFNGHMYSSMMDLIVVDHKNKLLYPCDLKTSSHHEYEFHKSFLDWNYDIQSRQYAAILKSVIENDDYFKDFKICNYRFIVVNRKSLNPLVWEWDHTFDDGTVELKTSKGYPVRLRNFKEIGEELSHYLETKQSIPDGVNISKVNNISEWINRL